MSGAAGGEPTVAIPPSRTIALGVVGGLIGIYATPLNPVLGPLLAALGAVCAIVWGADAIRRVASYGLGTGVPSIGYMSLAIGIIGVLAGLAGAVMIGPTYTLISPLLGFAIAMILGGVVALIGKKIVGMKIPILVQCTVELAGASALSVLGFSAAIAGSYAMPSNTNNCNIHRIHRTPVHTEYYGNSAPFQRMFRTKRRPEKNIKTCSNHSFHVNGHYRITRNWH